MRYLSTWRQLGQKLFPHLGWTVNVYFCYDNPASHLPCLPNAQAVESLQNTYEFLDSSKDTVQRLCAQSDVAAFLFVRHDLAALTLENQTLRQQLGMKGWIYSVNLNPWHTLLSLREALKTWRKWCSNLQAPVAGMEVSFKKRWKLHGNRWDE